eukprot:gb/GFBE01019064.1/.p1 GENE.gb/GFBE01019064.1/~~gb/GFBE01019064.1/.p1  ORF type:complete len:134 (+),score=13.99 gb/GFBE01019064.1/:1-402(+)
MTYASGQMYVGEWLEDKRHGQGCCQYSDGSHFKGAWRCGKRDGQGCCVYADGSCYDGPWKSGVCSGRAVFTNGPKRKEHWGLLMDPRERLTGEFDDDKPYGEAITAPDADLNQDWSRRVFFQKGELCQSKFSL